MKKLIFISIFLFTSSKYFADIAVDPKPGQIIKKYYTSSIIFIKDVSKLPKDWRLYISTNYNSTPKRLYKNTKVQLVNDGGVPDYLIIWAQNKKSHKKTAEIYVLNIGGTRILDKLTVRNDSLFLNETNVDPSVKTNQDETIIDTSQKSTLEENNSVKASNSYEDEVIIYSSNTEQDDEQDGTQPTIILIVIAGTSLALLTWIFIRKKRKG